jgi:hypothetical protein
MTPRRASLIVLALVAVTVAGCGANGGGGGAERETRLTAAEAASAKAAIGAVNGYCRKLALFLAGKRREPDTEDADRAQKSADTLVSVARAKPDAALTEAVTMRDALADMAEDLEGSNCASGLVGRLDQGLSSLPPPR